MTNLSMDEVTINGVIYTKKTEQQAAANDDGLKYAIVRSRDQGVMCGFVESTDGRTVTLRNARQMWRWSSPFVLVDAAEHGMTDKWESRFSCEASEPVIMLEACGVLYCTQKSMLSLRAVEAQVNE